MGHLARFSGEFGGSGGSGRSGGNGGESRTDPEPLGSLGSSECSGAFEVSVVFSVGSEKKSLKIRHFEINFIEWRDNSAKR